MIMNRLTMLAVTLMASIACFAQGNGKMATSLINQPHAQGDIVDLYELRYYIVAVEGDILSLEVIGFASDITGTVGAVYGDTGDPNKVTDKYKGVLEIPSNYPASEVGFKCQITSIAENAFTATTCRNDDTKYKSKFADAAALVNKILISYDAEFPNAITIGDNAFGSFTCVTQSNGTLTGLTEVENQTPGDKVADISATSFASSVYVNATLKVPDGAMGKYNTAVGWQNFLKITDSTGRVLGDFNGDGKIKSKDYKELLKLTGLSASDPSYTVYADMDGNGKIASKDIKLLLSKMN